MPKCPICSRPFENEKGVLIHFGKMHEMKGKEKSSGFDKQKDRGNSRFRCPICQETFGSEKGVSIHIGKMHNDQGRECKEKDVQREQIQKITERNIKKFDYGNPRQEGNRKWAVKDKQRENGFSCPVCCETFGSEKGVSIHVSRMHGNRKEETHVKKSGPYDHWHREEARGGKSGRSDQSVHTEEARRVKSVESYQFQSVHMEEAGKGKSVQSYQSGHTEEAHRGKSIQSYQSVHTGEAHKGKSVQSYQSGHTEEARRGTSGRSGQTVDKATAGASKDMPVFCHICRYPCKNSHGLEIHVSAKHPDLPTGKFEDVEKYKAKPKPATEGKGKGASVSGDSGYYSIGSQVSRQSLSKLREDTEKITLRKNDVAEAAKAVNIFIDKFSTKLKEVSTVSFDVLASGSYYDKTKNGYPDEFDYMFYPRKVVVRPTYDGAPYGYCKLEIMAIPDELKFRVETGKYLDPVKYKDYIFSLFKTVLADKTFRSGMKIQRKERPDESPAYTVLYTGCSGKELDIDLVPCIQIAGWPDSKKVCSVDPKWTNDSKLTADCMSCYHVVTKTCPDDIPNNNLMWRLSFSWAEKVLIKHANSGDEKCCCRKFVFRLMKAVLEETKERNKDRIKKFCSYHLKMYMLEQFDNPRFQSRSETEASLFCFALRHLIEILGDDTTRGYPKIRNYFIPKDNIIRAVSRSELDLVRKGFQRKYDSLQH